MTGLTVSNLTPAASILLRTIGLIFPFMTRLSKGRFQSSQANQLLYLSVRLLPRISSSQAFSRGSSTLIKTSLFQIQSTVDERYRSPGGIRPIPGMIEAFLGGPGVGFNRR